MVRKLIPVVDQVVAFNKWGVILTTLPETNSEFAPKNGWLEYYNLLLGFGLFSGANC